MSPPPREAPRGDRPRRSEANRDRPPARSPRTRARTPTTAAARLAAATSTTAAALRGEPRPANLFDDVRWESLRPRVVGYARAANLTTGRPRAATSAASIVVASGKTRPAGAESTRRARTSPPRPPPRGANGTAQCAGCARGRYPYPWWGRDQRRGSRVAVAKRVEGLFSNLRGGEEGNRRGDRRNLRGDDVRGTPPGAGRSRREPRIGGGEDRGRFASSCGSPREASARGTSSRARARRRCPPGRAHRRSSRAARKSRACRT